MEATLPQAGIPTVHRPPNLIGVAAYKAWHYDNRPANELTDLEADKIQWIDPASGLDCLIVRHPTMGQWCGYVGVGPEHRYYGSDYMAIAVSAHGGLTYADKCQEGHPHEGLGVCHVPFAGRSEDIWWFGFDCGHSEDVVPWADIALLREGEGKTYKTELYVARETERLARQLARA